MQPLITSFSFLLLLTTACKKDKGPARPNLNNPPLVSLATQLTATSPITVRFTATATDAENDPLTYTWDFGNGTNKKGSATETATYNAGSVYNVKLTVADGKSDPVVVTTAVDANVITVTADGSKRFQTMEGFGGFGAQDVYWSNGPFTSTRFVDDLINDLGLTMLRDEIPVNFELTNDNNDPAVTDLSKFNLTTNINSTQPLGARIPYFKSLYDAGLRRFIFSVWSPPLWMKHNNQLGNGTQSSNSAPPYTTSPTASTNQLRTDMYTEFAEMCIAFVRIIKRDVGVEPYAISVQNEPRFSQFYQSAVYNGDALRDLMKVVGRRFETEGIGSILFAPEDVGWFDGADALIQPTLRDPDARKHLRAVATHGYAFDGVTASSTDAQTWQRMQNWGAPHGLPLWMTETSGFENNHEGAIKLGKAMYTAFTFGNVSAWVFWTLSTGTLDSYSLMNSAGQKSKRYFVSKNFYRYVRPGAVRSSITAPDNSGVLPVYFQHASEGTQTLVMVNDNTTGKLVRLSGISGVSQFNLFITSATEDCKASGTVNTTDPFFLPPKSVVTLYNK